MERAGSLLREKDKNMNMYARLYGFLRMLLICPVTIFSWQGQVPRELEKPFHTHATGFSPSMSH